MLAVQPVVSGLFSFRIVSKLGATVSATKRVNPVEFKNSNQIVSFFLAATDATLLKLRGGKLWSGKSRPVLALLGAA